MLESLRIETCMHLNYVLNKLPTNLPYEMADSETIYSKLKTELNSIRTSLASTEIIDANDYPKLTEHIGNLAQTLQQIRIAYHRASRQNIDTLILPSSELCAFPQLLHALFLHHDKLKLMKETIKQELGRLEEIRQEKEFQKFINEVPTHFTDIRNRLNEEYKNNEGNANYTRTLSVIIKCEAVRENISKLTTVIGARWSARTAIDNDALPEGLLWHPENFEDKKTARIVLMGLVYQYIHFFKEADKNNLLKDFCSIHSDTACFEMTMSNLSDWMIEKKLLSSAAREHIKLSPLELMEKFIQNNPKLGNDQLIDDKEFLLSLEVFCQNKFENIDSTKMNDEEIYKSLTESLANENLKLCIYQYTLNTLCLINNIPALDEAWEESLSRDKIRRRSCNLI